MGSKSIRERESQAIRRDWEAVGAYLLVAMTEIATELDGEEFALEVTKLAASDEVLPNPEALQKLEDKYPDSAKQVVDRAFNIQEETYQQGLTGISDIKVRSHGRALLEGLASLNIFGFPIKRP